ncbi:MAG: hypothetical protein WA633_26625, partial [Stellaceae bacterium]
MNQVFHRCPGAADKAGRTRELLARHGIECPAITGAGTGTFEFESASGVYTELQCGSYVFMDADYGRNLDRDGAPTKAFEPSLFVWATVMSRPTEDRWLRARQPDRAGLADHRPRCGLLTLDARQPGIQNRSHYAEFG